MLEEELAAILHHRRRDIDSYCRDSIVVYNEEEEGLEAKGLRK